MTQCESLRYKLLGGLAIRRYAKRRKTQRERETTGWIDALANCCVVVFEAGTRRQCLRFICDTLSILLIPKPDPTFFFPIHHSACYGIIRFVMESGAKGIEVVVSGKIRAQRAKYMKFIDGFMIHSGEPNRVSFTPTE